MVDIITFDFSNKLFKLKHNLLLEAAKRGIFIEMVYADAIKNSANRRMILSNLIN